MMSTRDPRVDTYIEKAPEFAKPILRFIRETVHAACPDCVETIKWSFPHFEYKGMLCSMAAFKHHAVFGFWKGSLILPNDTLTTTAPEGMGQFGRLTKVSDLPPKKVLSGYINKAMELNDRGVKVPMRRKAAPPKPLRVPVDLAAALKKNKKAQAAFDAFSPSHKREYVEWITEAKREETRARRLRTAIEWMAAGKPHNWKYMTTRRA
jgi:uncharacterized protein YdeI (YjbR/CyaY-like superfamily)